MLYHQNHLHYLHHCIAELDKTLKHLVSFDIDFSVNLTVPFNYEPQSLYCCRQQVTVHSQISKTKDNKNGYAFFSNDHRYDQVFVKHVLDDILSEMDHSHSQYKSTILLHDLQMLTNEKVKQFLKVWSIVGHGKREVDYASGMTKISIKRAVSNDCFFDKASRFINLINLL